MSDVSTGPDIGVAWTHQFINAAVSGITTGFSINVHNGVLAVITSITISNVSGSSGDVCALYDPVTGATIFQALRGMDIDTSFIWEGQWCKAGNFGLDVTCTGSSVWAIQASGYYLPDYWSRFA